MPQDDESTLVQVMAWCRQATSHYLSHLWLSPLSLYGVARPQWVNSINSMTVQLFFVCFTKAAVAEYHKNIPVLPWCGNRLTVIFLCINFKSTAFYVSSIHKSAVFLFNLLGPSRYGCILRLMICNLISQIDIVEHFLWITIRWMLQDLTDD